MKNLYERLVGYADKERISFAMPGHKGGKGFSAEFKKNIARIDVTELSDTENLHSPKCEIANAKQALATRFCSKESFFLTGGSTEGVQIMLFCAAAGGRVLTNRNCHCSVVNAAAIAGFDLCYLSQGTDSATMTPLPPTAEEVEAKLCENSDITACIITSPDYYGHIADIEGIAKVCHTHGIPLLADEAHGAALYAKGMQGGAMAKGADMAVQSAHKTLNALNQAAYLHWNSELVDIERVRRVAAMVATSSPSYPIVASAELALSELENSGWRELSDYLGRKREELLTYTDVKFPEGDTDLSRLVIGFSEYEISGYEVATRLREEYNIDIEMADMYNIVCIVTPTNEKSEIDSLFAAVADILSQAQARERIDFLKPPIAKQVMSPKDTLFAKCERVPLQDSEGRIAAATVTAYPPGTAIVAVGEKFSRAAIDYITKIGRMGAEVEGISDDLVLVVE